MYTDDNGMDFNLTKTCKNHTHGGFVCTVDNGSEDDVDRVQKPHHESSISPDPFRQGVLTVLWKAESISDGIFRQDSNSGDHRIRCQVTSSNISRWSNYVQIRGTYMHVYPMYLFVLIISSFQI